MFRPKGRHLFFVVVKWFECGEDGRTAFTEVHPQVPVQTLSELGTCGDTGWDGDEFVQGQKRYLQGQEINKSWPHLRGRWGAVGAVPVLLETSPRLLHRSYIAPLRCLKKGTNTNNQQFIKISRVKWVLIISVSRDNDADVLEMSYLVLGLFPGRGNRTSSPGSSPAGGDTLLLPRPDAPSLAATLLQKQRVTGQWRSTHDTKFILEI